MLQSIPGTGFDAARDARDTPVHQLKLWFGHRRFRIERQDPPWKVVRAFQLESQTALVHLHNVSGGVLAGDRLELNVELDAGAAAQITTTGATRLYRHRAGAADSEQRTSFLIGDGAELEYLPDPLIPYAGSRHIQRTEVQVGRGATVFWWEVLACGRLGAGERFAFERLDNRVEILVGKKQILREDYRLEPALRDLAATARMERYSHLVSLYAVREGRTADFWRGVEERMNEMARERTRPGESTWGASALVSDGILVRGLLTGGRLVHGGLAEFRRAARLAIAGSDAALPRKTY